MTAYNTNDSIPIREKINDFEQQQFTQQQQQLISLPLNHLPNVSLLPPNNLPFNTITTQQQQQNFQQQQTTNFYPQQQLDRYQQQQMPSSVSQPTSLNLIQQQQMQQQQQQFIHNNQFGSSPFQVNL